ncbi:hypothetical protein MBANPS3_012274 [Mucor bainieri]
MTDLTFFCPSVMRDINDLVQNVADVKVRNPYADLPAIDHLFKFIERGQGNFPVLKTTKHTVNIKKKIDNQMAKKSFDFGMNVPSVLLKHLVANLTTSSSVSLLPDDTPDQLVESDQGHKWKTHRLFQHPMVSAAIQNADASGNQMMTPEGGNVLVVVAPVQFITADNTRHAEIASSRGATSSIPCCKCNWELKPMAAEYGTDYESAKRSDAIVKSMYNRFLRTGGVNPKLLVYVSRGYKLVVGGQVLLKLETFDCMVDNPIEMLHTVTLGVGKALVKIL